MKKTGETYSERTVTLYVTFHAIFQGYSFPVITLCTKHFKIQYSTHLMFVEGTLVTPVEE